MPTAAQIAANRANAQRSTGPRTDDGKAKARQNALRHGLCSGIPTMADEAQGEIQTLLNTLREEHEPAGATEEILVYKMAEHFFYGIRARYLLGEQLDWADKGEENNREIGLMLRYHTTADRGYHKAFAELRKLQNERRLQEIGSVSQNAEAVPEERPADLPKPVPIPSNPAETAEPTVQPAATAAQKAPELMPEAPILVKAVPETAKKAA